MSDWTLLAPQWLWLMVVIPVWGGLGVYQRQKTLGNFRSYQRRPVKLQYRVGAMGVMMLSIALLVFALARPAWNPQPRPITEQGRDRIFLLDVSRSMLAADARPNRLEAARTAIRQTLGTSCSNRSGLAVFAGVTSILSPLTCDKLFFSNKLDSVSPDSVAQGGTRIQDALMTVLEKMVDPKAGARAVDIVLITDGEDLGETPDKALALLNKMGARLLVIGLGDSQFGARVPARDGEGWTQYEDREHWSRMDEASLGELARGASQGIFFPVGTSWLDLPVILDQLQTLWPGENRARGEVMEYTEGYPWLLAMALLMQLGLLLGPAFWRSRAMVIGILSLSFNAQATVPGDSDLAQAPWQMEKLANTLLEDQLYEEASEVWRQIIALADRPDLAVAANYNLATTLILAAESLDAAQLAAMDPDEVARLMEEGPMDPKVYYDEARQIFRHILQVDPAHQPSQRNLEWLVWQDQIRRPPESPQPQEQQPPPEQQDPEGEEGESSDQEEKPDQGESRSDQDRSMEEMEPADEASDRESMNQSFENRQWPSPSASAEEVLNQAKVREGLEQQEQRRNQRPVERDW